MVIGENDEITEECKQLWNLYKEYIISFCKFKLKDTPDYVEDCVQDVFMALLEARRSGTEIKSPKAWLTTVANNKIKMEYKNRKRESEHINKIIHYKTTVEFSTLDMHDFKEVSDELISEMKDSILNQLKFDEQSIIIDFYVKHLFKAFSSPCTFLSLLPFARFLKKFLFFSSDPFIRVLILPLVNSKPFRPFWSIL